MALAWNVNSPSVFVLPKPPKPSGRFNYLIRVKVLNWKPAILQGLYLKRFPLNLRSVTGLILMWLVY